MDHEEGDVEHTTPAGVHVQERKENETVVKEQRMHAEEILFQANNYTSWTITGQQ